MLGQPLGSKTCKKAENRIGNFSRSSALWPLGGATMGPMVVQCRKNRRVRALRALPLALAACLGSCSQDEHPNVILVVVDTLRADRMSCYGYFRPTTPFLDRLAEEGALFEDVTAQFSWTVPSMVSMFTGRYLTDLSEQVAPGQRTIAQAFRKAGYRTLGASANLLLQKDTGLLAGFDSFEAMPEDSNEKRSLSELASGVLNALDRQIQRDADTKPAAPVFIYLHAFETHDPYRRWSEADQTLPVTEAIAIQPEGWMIEQLQPFAELAPVDDPLWRSDRDWINRARGRYEHEIRLVDSQLEAFLDELRLRGLLDNAVVALVSDHGEGLWEHEPPHWIFQRAIATEDFWERLPREIFYQKHGAIQFQEVLATPMLIWGSGVSKGVRIPSPVENIDLLPTLLQLADIPAISGLHGRSLVPQLTNQRSVPRPYVFSLGVQAATVRETASGLKLIVPQRKSASLGEPHHLFRLGDDPYERHDLAESQPADVERLRRVFDEWVRLHPVKLGNQSGSRAAERTAALRRRLTAIGYSSEETTSEE